MPNILNLQLDRYSEIEARIQYAEKNELFDEARRLQDELVQKIERNPSCTSGALGDALFRLAFYSYKCGYYKVAQMEIAKSIGYRRLFFGKGNEKVRETVELAKVIQDELSKLEPRRIRRKRSPLSADSSTSN
ncbi:MAG TPA: hypothetical protein EYN91_18215 [Candidatus Melainabacteria bacterium]|nr:hypothetical protein [Candidatus Melainabacteria bacterium]